MKIFKEIILFLLIVNSSCTSINSRSENHYDFNYSICETVKVEVVIAVPDYSKKDSTSFIKTGIFEDNYDAFIINDTLKSITEMYKFMSFVDISPVLECSNYKTKLPVFLEYLESKDSLVNSNNVLIVQDDRYATMINLLNKEGSLYMTGRTNKFFKGHVYRTYKVNLTCKYVGKRIRSVRNFGLGLSKDERMTHCEILCNCFHIVSVDKIRSTTVDSGMFSLP